MSKNSEFSEKSLTPEIALLRDAKTLSNTEMILVVSRIFRRAKFVKKDLFQIAYQRISMASCKTLKVLRNLE
jgi:hypothetical protein